MAKIGEQRGVAVALGGRFRVVLDAVVGGGVDLRKDEVVDSTALGIHLPFLIAAGAVARVPDEVAATLL